MKEQCPYCDSDVEINHDDGYGYDEGETYQQECGSCEKIFVYTTCISISHELEKADCLNGAEHKFKKTNTYPERYSQLRCVDCGELRPLP